MHFAWTCQAIFPPRYCRCTAKGLKPLILQYLHVRMKKKKWRYYYFEAQLKIKRYPIQGKKNYQWQEWVNSIIFTSICDTGSLKASIGIKVNLFSI